MLTNTQDSLCKGLNLHHTIQTKYTGSGTNWMFLQNLNTTTQQQELQLFHGVTSKSRLTFLLPWLPEWPYVSCDMQREHSISKGSHIFILFYPFTHPHGTLWYLRSVRATVPFIFSFAKSVKATTTGLTKARSASTPAPSPSPAASTFLTTVIESSLCSFVTSPVTSFPKQRNIKIYILSAGVLLTFWLKSFHLKNSF